MILINAVIALGTAWALWMLVVGLRSGFMEPMSRGLTGAYRQKNPILFWADACINVAMVCVGTFLLFVADDRQ